MPSADASSSSTETRRLTKPHHHGAPPPEQEHLPCPRCDSTNTKFCYYNNYNFSQPRHFCKSCRRYWTHGGTLRDIPIGGGTRKNAKRSRTSATVVCPITAATADNVPLPATPVFVPLMANQGQFGCGAGDGKGNGSSTTATHSNVCGSFTSLLNTQGPGFLALGGFSLGLGSGIEDMGFGLARGLWPFPGVVDGAATGGGGNVGGGGAVTGMSGAWQFESSTDQNGFVGGGDCFNFLA